MRGCAAVGVASSVDAVPPSPPVASPLLEAPLPLPDVAPLLSRSQAENPSSMTTQNAANTVERRFTIVISR
jgi:hypothetical protein